MLKYLTNGLKTCRRCKLDQPASEFHKNVQSKDQLTIYCKTCVRHKHVKKYVPKLRVEKIDWQTRGVRVCKTCGEEKSLIDFRRVTAGLLGRSAHCKKCSSTNWKNRYARLKNQILENYGTSCACCGETIAKFLTIEHKNNDGGLEKKAKGMARMITELANGPIREDIQILCFNCNCAKYHNYGVCPHKEIKS